MKLTFEETIYLVTLFMISLLLAKRLVDLIIKCKREDMIRFNHNKIEDVIKNTKNRLDKEYQRYLKSDIKITHKLYNIRKKVKK